MTMTVEITTTRVGTTALVAPHGDIDLVTSPDFRTAVHAAIDDGADAMVIDLSGSGFLDSTALGVLVSVHRRLGDRLAVACPQPAVRRLFDITRFSTVLRLHASVDEALAAVR